MGRGIANPDIVTYLREMGCRETPELQALAAETADMPMAMMQIGAVQAAFLGTIARISGAKRYLEIGVFTGYSSLAMAQAMGPGGRVVACDISEEWTSVARRHWAAAGVADQIDLRLAPALETLATLEPGFDIAFIDADKVNYEGYYEACLRLVRKGGLIVVDNVLWGGSILDEDPASEDTRALQAFNRARRNDERVDLSMVAVGDGLSLLRVR